MSDRPRNDELRHNPYVGTFVYTLEPESTRIVNEYLNSTYFNNIFSKDILSNPLLGFFRHSQSTQTVENEPIITTRDVGCQVNMDDEFVMIDVPLDTIPNSDANDANDSNDGATL